MRPYFVLSSLCLVLSAFLVVEGAEAKIKRSATARAEFKRLNPCPVNGTRRGRCPGYVIDHVKPLACGGEDAPVNMQWQTVADAKIKDKWERRECRRN